LKICLLSYRGNPYSGGQGIYIHYLSRELIKLGHDVHVLSGPPYPEVVDGITLHKLESLSLYDRRYSLTELIASVNNPLRFYEFIAVCCGTFPEPFTFSIRAYNRLKGLLSKYKFDIVHDNQCLGYGLLLMKRLGIPVVTTIHHPVPIDRELELAQAKTWWDKFRLKRWYSFTNMQYRVTPGVDRIITVSENSATDIKRVFNVPDDLLRVVLNGIDTDIFNCDGNIPKVPNSLIMVSSGAGHTKGGPYLFKALHQLKDDYNIKLTVIGSAPPESEQAKLVREYGLEDRIHFTGKIEREELLRLYASAEIAVVPSLYEGFGLPAAEAMSCGLPVISSTAGALPEVVGKDGSTGILVPPADSTALATAITQLINDPQRRSKMGKAGRKRVEDNFSWKQAAIKTVQVYEEFL